MDSAVLAYLKAQDLTNTEFKANVIAALRSLVKSNDEAVGGREAFNQTVGISQNYPYIIDYRDRKHVYMFSSTSITISLEDLGFYTIPANQWTDISFTPGLRIFAPGQASTVYVAIKQTDNSVTSPGGLAGIPVYQTATGTSGGAVTCTLAAPTQPNMKTYIQGFVLTSQTNASVLAAVAYVSLDGGTTQHLKFDFCIPTAVGGFLPVSFPGNGLPATATDTSIQVVIPSMSSGSVALAISAWGVQQQ